VRSKKISLGISAGLLAVMALAGCSSVSSPSGGSGDTKVKGDITIAMSVGQLDDQFLSTLADYMKKEVAAKGKGWKLLPIVSANRDANKQVSDVQNLLARDPSVLVIHPTDSAAIVAAVQAANAKGIPVYTVDTPANGGKVVANIRADNVQAGEQAAKTLVEGLKTKSCWSSSCTVLELQGLIGSAAGDDRSQGVETELKKYSQIKLISRPTDWDAQKAADAAQNVIASNPQIAGITMASELMLPGTLGALKSANLTAKVGSADHVVLTGIDGTPYAMQAIRDGQYDASISQPLTNYVDGLLAIIQATAKDGKKISVGPAEFGGIKGNVVKIPAGPDFQLPATPVTKANVDDKTLWGNLSAGK